MDHTPAGRNTNMSVERDQDRSSESDIFHTFWSGWHCCHYMGWQSNNRGRALSHLLTAPHRSPQAAPLSGQNGTRVILLARAPSEAMRANCSPPSRLLLWYMTVSGYQGQSGLPMLSMNLARSTRCNRTRAFKGAHLDGEDHRRSLPA